jgi:glycosyltransferase involved in cell wall biosynthesis
MTGTPAPELCDEINSAGVAGKVHFAGITNNDELARLYRGATAFVFPSLYEGFGLPPLEAMACGAPVLVSNVCSLPEVVGDAGLLVDPKDIGAIAENMRILVHSEETQKTLRAQGLLRAKRFTWLETARKTMEVLQSALSTG